MADATIERVAVLGMGTMGSGIALTCAQAGLPVTVLETEDAALTRGAGQIRAFLAGGISRGKLTTEQANEIAGRITGTTEIGALAGSQLVIEAVVESLEVKLELLPRVATVVGEQVAIATNTSALSVTELASSVPDPGRVGGLHFFNPAPLMKLIEVVEALPTRPETIATLTGFGAQLGKYTVVVKDRPGFLVNRLLMPYLNQLIQAYDDGVASGEDLDTALELGLGYPMGGLRLLDLIGADTHHHATSAAYEQTADPHLAPPSLLTRMVDAGYLGDKADRGFRKGTANG